MLASADYSWYISLYKILEKYKLIKFANRKFEKDSVEA
jgi:hypothetical protein